MFLNEIGEDTLCVCDGCGYSANLQVARFRKPEPLTEASTPPEKVATPACATIDELAAFLEIDAARTAKVVFFTAAVPGAAAESADATREVLALALVRGDMQANETKIGNALRARWLRPATAAEIVAVGAEPGYASPIGILRDGVIVIVDDLVARSPNLVSGANEHGYHLRNVTCGRDYTPDLVADITSAVDGSPCVDCGADLRLVRGVEVGNIFQLGTRYTEALGATFLDAEGQSRPVVMGSYGIGMGRLLACLAEAHNDDRGLKLPITAAPYEVYLVSLSGRDTSLDEQAEELYRSLAAAGIEVLFDDRDVSAGVKFADADLIGIPLRVTLSGRSVKAGGAEVKRRDQSEARIVGLDLLSIEVRRILDELYVEVAAGVRSDPYPG
jgi:prolyl-tRNA synthetase